MLTRRTFSKIGTSAAALWPLPAIAQSQPSSQLPSLKMQASWVNDAEFLGYFVALDPDHRFFEKAGVRVDYLSGGPAVVPETSLISGRADLALATPETTAQYIVRDKIDFRIIGAQYQRNPIGIVSLAKAPIKSPKELVGKRLAVAAVSRLTVQALLSVNHIDPKQVRLVPYTYDPKILTSGAADASVDFVTNIPYVLRKLGETPHSFLLDEFGLTLYNDVVVVRKEVLERKFDALVSWMVGSIQGWEENYRDQTYRKYPERYAGTWFKGNGRTIENEVVFNEMQYPLMRGEKAPFEMSNSGIRRNIKALEVLNLRIRGDVFDTRVIEAALAKLNRS
jgi:ABC-type nitrate/sulfonate/bicarbonate transport system substrate-binding protein